LPPAPTLGVLNTNDLSLISQPNDVITNNNNNVSNKNINQNGEKIDDITASNNQSINVSQQMTTLLHGTICNCINIASCNQDDINCFIHSKDCILNKVAQ
jgi:hypothetical protein